MENADFSSFRSTTTKVLRKRYIWLLGIIGLPGIGDLLREYLRGRAMDWAVSKLAKLGWFGDWLTANPVALTSIGVVIALVTLTAMVSVESGRERPSPIYEHRDKPFMKPPASRNWLLGFIAVMAMIVCVLIFGIYKYQLHTSTRIGASGATTKLPDIPAEQPIATTTPQAPAEVGHSRKKSSANEGSKLPPAGERHIEPLQQVPQQAQQTNQQSDPPVSADQPSTAQSQLERVVVANKNLPQGDRERLSNLLYEFSQTLDKMTALGYKANREVSQIGNEVHDGSIVKDYEVHLKTLREISDSGKKMAMAFLQARETEKWRYYSDQMGYVFGDNPDNLGPNSIINATDSYATNLDQWSSIKDRENKAALNLLEAPRIESERLLHTFFDWKGGCENRLEQMRQSIK
jgi:hypothetical protein